MMDITDEILRSADSRYVLFPRFAEWSGKHVDEQHWTRYKTRLAERAASAGPRAHDTAVERTIREAALDTGAIEGLYQTSRGITYSVAVEAAAWQVQLSQQGELAPRLFQAQLAAYESVMDAATQSRPMSDVLIRTLHETLTAPQETYKVLTAVGWQEQPLPKGQYKTQPNHPWREGGELLKAYAPVSDTPAEMGRLIEELRTPDFESAHPVLQAAYAHYALVAIHPFADGNGRVARAVASVFLYRAARIPLLIYADQTGTYLSALERADAGDHQAFTDFVFDRGISALARVSEVLRVAELPTPAESVARLRQLTTSAGGLTYPELDTIAARLMGQLREELQHYLDDLGLPSTIVPQVVNHGRRQLEPPAQGYRQPIHPPVGGVGYQLRGVAPADVQVQERFDVFVAFRPDARATFIILRGDGDTFEVPVGDVHPEVGEDLKFRLRLLVEATVQAGLVALQPMIEEALRTKGYLE